MRINMPARQEKEALERKKERDLRVYRPLPIQEAGVKETNSVVVVPFKPKNWGLFNPDATAVEKYGLVGDGHSTVAINSMASLGGEDLYTFYLRVMVHSVPNYQYPDGGTGFANLLCPKHFNNYLTEGLGAGPLFDSPVRCAFCEEAAKYWELYDQRWQELGVDRKKLTKEGRQEYIQRDSALKSIFKKAADFGHNERYILMVLDWDKFTKSRPLDDGEMSVVPQVWFAPRGVFDHFHEQYGLDDTIFDFEDSAVPVKMIQKDTTECSANNFMRTRYRVLGSKSEPLDPQWISYLSAPENLPDPSDFLVLSSYEEQLYYCSSSNEGANDYSYSFTQQSATPPTMPSVPQGSPPVGAPSGAPSPEGSPTPPVPAIQPAPSVPTSPATPVPATPPVPTLPQGMPQAPVPQAPITKEAPDRNPPGGDGMPTSFKW